MDIATDLISDIFSWLRFEFWYFIRPFLYGGIGGLSIFFMSYLSKESNSLHRRNELLIRGYDINHLDKINLRSKRFLFKAMLIYFFVSGVSGMIAVNAFNSSANELQTFSIAVIAGLGGFTFLKRSAIVDEKETDGILDVEALEIIGEYDSLLFKFNEFEENIDEVAGDLEIADYEADNLGEDGAENKMDDFLKFLQSEFVLNEDEMELLELWVEEGLSQKEIMERLLNFMDS